MATGSFGQLLQTLAEQDFFVGVLPFLLTYVLFYISLRNVPIFEEKGNERLAGLVAVIGGLFVSYFLIQNPAFQGIMTDYFARITLGLIGILGLFIFMGFMGYDGKYFKTWGILAAVIVLVAAAFTVSGGLRAFGLGGLYNIQAGGLGNLIEQMFNSGLIWVAVIVGALWFTMGDSDSSDDSNPLMDMMKVLGKNPED